MRLDTVGLVATLALVLLLVPLAADVQQATPVRRIGWLVAGPPAGAAPRNTFRQGMRDLGYVEGRHRRIESRDAEGSAERLRDLAAELVRLQVEVIVAAGNAATRAAQQARGRSRL